MLLEKDYFLSLPKEVQDQLLGNSFNVKLFEGNLKDAVKGTLKESGRYIPEELSLSRKDKGYKDSDTKDVTIETISKIANENNIAQVLHFDVLTGHNDELNKLQDVEDEYRPCVCKMLQNFDAVSIREQCSLPLLESLGRADGVAVCDPVFLLTRKQWETVLPQNQSHEEYLLVYDTEFSPKVKEIAKRIAKEKNLKIYNVSASRIGYADKDLWASSPIDFVQLIRDASYVVSNSFHASAFSIIFERDFCVINRSEGINERMKSLLSNYKLEERLVAGYSEKLLNPVDYQQVRPQVLKDIEYSKGFLNQSL